MLHDIHPNDDDDTKPSDFGQMLAEFEREKAVEGAAAVASGAEAAGALHGTGTFVGGPGRGAVEPVVGTQVRGRIVSIAGDHAFVDFGGRSEGALELRHIRDDAGELRHQLGDLLTLYVVEARDQVVLAPSLKADPRVALDQIRSSHAAGLPVTGKVTGLNAGGLEVDISGVRGFCPFSQIDTSYVADPSTYVGKTLEFAITQLEESRGNAVLSRRQLLKREEEDKARRTLAALHPGLEVDGTVRRLEPFGAFVDIGGLDGLVHVSEIRYERTEHPKDALLEGQKVRTRVLRVDTGKDGRPRISLSIKAAAPDPWSEIEEHFWKGRKCDGTVVRLADFGAFVNVAPGIDGLVHVTEAALHPVQHVKEVLEPNQRVQVVVMNIDKEKKRLSLSIKESLAREQRGESPDDDGRGSLDGDASASGVERLPAQGDIAEGFVANIKPYGLFVDLPAYGHRARGLCPHEETGERRGADLAKRFQVGDKVKVEVLDVTEGKIRLSLARMRDREEKAGFESYARESHQSRTPNTGMAEAFKRAMEKNKP